MKGYDKKMGLEIQISKDFGDYKLDIDLKSDSRRLAILGASGSGKSLTLKVIAGIINPDKGRIVVDGRCLYDSSAKINLPSRVRKVGYLFQNYALFPTMTVQENIGIGIINEKRKNLLDAKGNVVQYYIEKFGLEDVKELYPKQLSMGQQQRVALARIMASKPEVILLDEPFSALDDYMREQTCRELQHFLEEYKGIVVIVSHNREEIYQFSEEMMVIHEGKTVDYGNTLELFKKPESLYTATLTGCKNIGSFHVEGNHCIIPEWDIRLDISNSEFEFYNKQYTHIGIRAHNFLIDKPKQGMYYEIPVDIFEIEKGIWDYTVYFKASKKAKVAMKWKLPGNQIELDYFRKVKKLYLAEKDLLLLKK